ncbi:MAG: hypothetical protein C5B51_22210, partial [Terriglobia bacterium]
MRRLAALAVVIAAPVWSQTAGLRGRVTDPSGSVVPGASVTLLSAGGSRYSTRTTVDGAYLFSGLRSGEYLLQASAPSLTVPEPLRVTLDAGLQVVNLELQLERASQQVTVQDSAGPAVTTDPTGNASALVMRGDDLAALADDPEDLQADLEALAGPSAGPSGTATYIDGFSGSGLPPKESIREVRINQNPFSPEYDKLGYGRIEVFTKPGTEKFHGTGYCNFADDAWNSRNPYAQQKAPFLLHEFGASGSGPLNRRTSFFVNLERHAIDNGAVIHGSTLDPVTLAVVDPFTDVHRIPQRRVIIYPRLDYQLSANQTLALRYGFTDVDIHDAGIGSFNLVSRGVHARGHSHAVQIMETAALGSTINETRFQFLRNDASNMANQAGAAIQVLGAFNGGGAPVRYSSIEQNSYELQNYTTMLRGAHTWRWGGRLRAATTEDVSQQNFGGTFTFAGGPGITSIERYSRTLLYQQAGLSPAEIRALGGGASQFTIVTGNPRVSAGHADAGLFFGDDWRLRPNVTVSFGLRYEAQNHVDDWSDFAPRLAVAWAPGAKRGKSSSKTVLRAGFGMFYDRFSLTNTITALRYNGLIEQQYSIADPDFFPLIPPPATLASFASAQTRQQISSSLRAPYLLQAALSVERQLPRNTTIALTYTGSHGVHTLRSNVVLNEAGSIYLMESSGLYNQNQVIANVNTRATKKISLMASYTHNHVMSTSDGLSTFPANPIHPSGEYGPAATDVHHRVSMSGSIETWGGLRLSPLLNLESGPPFDITVGRDLYGDTLFNGRPGFATDPNRPGVIPTRYGLLDPNPIPGENIVPRNFGRGPGSIMFNVRAARAFAFGSRAASGKSSPGTDHRFNLTISMSARNLLNHNNPGPIIGNITSPLFGQANQPAGA